MITSGSHDVCRAAVVHKYAPNVVAIVVYGVSTDVGPNYEGVIMQIVLELHVRLCEGDGHVRPWGFEMLLLTDMANPPKLLFLHPLGLMNGFA